MKRRIAYKVMASHTEALMTPAKPCTLPACNGCPFWKKCPARLERPTAPPKPDSPS